MLTQEQLKEIIHYDPETGIITWIKSGKGKKINAGYINDSGYLIICIFGRRYRAHRLAYLYITGHFPTIDTDHEDLNKQNNKWENIRNCTRSQNMMNTSKRKDNNSGFKGVSWDKSCNKWRARINLNNKETLLGYFSDKFEAAKAYEIAALNMFKEFARVE